MQPFGSSFSALLVASMLLVHSGFSLPSPSPLQLWKKEHTNWSRSCDMRRAKLPTGDGPTYLSPPSPMSLKLVLIGRGTQNYTCADSTSESIPVANGAQAALYDASCFASEAPDIFKYLPEIFLEYFNVIPSPMVPPKVGQHYFQPDASTPVFRIDKKVESEKKGWFVGKKLENVPAPATADKGVAPDAFGAVDWLKLGKKDGVVTGTGPLVSVGYSGVYRVLTAGGKPPANCQGRPKQFKVQYAASYWLYE